jgi:serine/threonine protein kinase
MEGRQFGRYRLLELLGQGGMGEVWRAHDTETDRIVALKVLHTKFAEDETFQIRFRREAHAAAGLIEPHVVPIHHYGEINGRLYVDMRLIEGRSLDTVISDGPLDPARAVTIVEQIGAALNAAHKGGLVHRDVKPSNILVGELDFAYLIDFGIARAVDQSKLTQTGQMIGTWAYMAPERLSHGREDSRSDTYSLACVLYECLVGSTPYPGHTVEQQVVGHLTAPPPRPSVTGHVPAAFGWSRQLHGQLAVGGNLRDVLRLQGRQRRTDGPLRRQPALVTGRRIRRMGANQAVLQLGSTLCGGSLRSQLGVG